MEASIDALTQAAVVVENANKYGQDSMVNWLPIVVDPSMYAGIEG